MEKKLIKNHMLSLGGSQVDKINQISLLTELETLNKFNKFKSKILRNFKFDSLSHKTTCEQKFEYVNDMVKRYLRIEKRRIKYGLRR